jgi:hypothetical protein
VGENSHSENRELENPPGRVGESSHYKEDTAGHYKEPRHDNSTSKRDSHQTAVTARSRRHYAPHEAVQILEAVTNVSLPVLADALASWVDEGLRRKPKIIHNPADYFAKVADRFLRENQYSGQIVEKYEGFAQRHGCTYCKKLSSWLIAKYHVNCDQDSVHAH